MSDVGRLVIGPAYGTCWDCNCWLSEADKYNRCGPCDDKWNKASRELTAEVDKLIAEGKFKKLEPKP